MPEDRYAPDGQIWVCSACGKIARDLYGLEGEHSQGWDESCVLNAVLCYEMRHVDPLDGVLKWFAVKNES